MRILFVLGLFGMLAAAGLPMSGSQAAAPGAESWEIGPTIRGRNYSVGMPPRPTPIGRSSWSFEFPYPNRDAGHVHAITFDPGSLRGVSRIIMRYRIDAAEGTRFRPQEAPHERPTISLYLQRAGDNWSARGDYDFYRWYSPEHSMREVAPGVHEMEVSLADPAWRSIMGTFAPENPRGFVDALTHSRRLGIAFGSSRGRAHGVYATGPARFTLLEFRVI